MTSFSDITFNGSMVALVTPMLPGGDLDYESYRALIDWHISEGTEALVVAATTGESHTVSIDEHAELIRVAVQHSNERIPIIAGVGANSTSEAIDLTRHAKNIGAKAGLSVVPYYNKPSQEGLYQHFRTISEAVELPLLMYNVPKRTAIEMSHETILRLAEIPGIIGIKDASGDIAKGVMLIRDAPDGFQIFSGDDATAAALMILGASGNISVTANIVPRQIRDLCMACINGDAITARGLNLKLAPLNQALFIESNPIPVKWALNEMGRTALGYRLPLVGLNPANREFIRKVMHSLNLI
ncbi:MAG: 4-hydroxy-tetrahydrodipicolinate synthase [Bordetella sp.]|nr:MAG: 4-hydroxy-tetrahydrodipicolinate synthase [Bordetella sp.]